MTRDGRADRVVKKKKQKKPSRGAAQPARPASLSYNPTAATPVMQSHATCTHMPHGVGFPDPRNFGQVDLGFRAKFGASMLLHHLSRRWILGGEGSALLAARVEAGCKN